MAKKKDKPQVINNIHELNLEIDYDKLAEAIVKAEEKSETESNKKKKFTSGTFVILTSISFRCMAVFGWILAIVMSSAIIHMIKTLAWIAVEAIIGNVLGIILSVGLIGVLAIYSFILWKSAKEIETEKDRNYIISVFSGIVSFAALIVALVALFKGVG